MTEITTFRLRIQGRVQGVGFRDWAVVEARSLKLNGWVRNRRDGTVEMVVSGSDEIIHEMLRRLTQGPDLAQVTQIDLAKEDEIPAPGFDRRATL